MCTETLTIQQGPEKVISGWPCTQLRLKYVRELGRVGESHGAMGKGKKNNEAISLDMCVLQGELLVTIAKLLSYTEFFICALACPLHCIPKQLLDQLS